MKEIVKAEFSEQNGYSYYQGRRYVSHSPAQQQKLIKEHHDTSIAAHPGMAITCDLLSQKNYWIIMRKPVTQYIWKCAECHR
jgi:hypothetical protein